MTFFKKGILSFSVILSALIIYTLLPFHNKYMIIPDVSSQSKVSQEGDRVLPGEQFILSNMINEDGTLRTYLKPNKSTDPQTAAGHESLSESMGLWLLYAYEKGDLALFSQYAEVVKNSFMKSDGWIAWKVGSTSKPATTNALVDDMRIAYAFYKAGAKWQDESYKKTADTITKSVMKKQVVNSTFRDFYDIEKNWPSNVITLPYLDAYPLVNLYEQSKISEDMYQKTKKFIMDLPLKNGFYPYNYRVDDGHYEYQKQINLLDQLFVETSRAKFGQTDTEFWSFLKQTFEDNHVLYGKYDIETKKHAVEYESPSVYGMAIIVALEHNEIEFAKDLYYRMIRFQTLNPTSEYYGGYMNYQQKDTHIYVIISILISRKEAI